MASYSEQIERLCRGVVDVVIREEFVERIESGKRLRIKVGFDPTRPDLHLGHTVLLEKMRQFQSYGHEVVFVVGDFTAMVGDPTGQNEQRPRLSEKQVREAAETYTTQAFKVLDSEKTVVRYNSEWLAQLKTSEVVELAAKYTVARMLERDDFSKRFKENRPIHIHEFTYPLLQAYDSVVLECDIELGGTDQLFNLLVGRDIMPRYGKKPQLIMTTPLLEGTDAKMVDGVVTGQKMSKSADNYVGIQEPPAAMLEKLMLVDDQVLWHYMRLLSARNTAEIDEQHSAVCSGTLDIIQAKEDFAAEIIRRFHNDEAAREAVARRHQVAGGGIPDDIVEVSVPARGDSVGLGIAIKLADLAKSTSEATRLIKQGGVYFDGERVKNEKQLLQKGQQYLVRVGGKRRRFARVRID